MADFDGDSAPDIALVRSGRLALLDGATGGMLFDGALPGSGSGGPPTIADFDGDGNIEVGVAMADFYSVHRPNFSTEELELVWQTPNHDFSSSVTGSTVFDFEGDGRAEVVYNDECFLWVFDGVTGEIRFATPTTSFTATEASLVADVDGDAHAELLMISNGASPTNWKCNISPWTEPDPVTGRPAWEPPAGQDRFRGLTLFADAANSWVGTRTLWNQHTYHVSNICDGSGDVCGATSSYGDIPSREASNWDISFLNNFRQNIQGQGIFNAPDPTVTLQVACTTPSTLFATLRNAGSAPLPPDVEIGFYNAAGILLGTSKTTGRVYPGQTETVQFSAPELNIVDSYEARIHADPATAPFRECRDDNNNSGLASAICIE